MIVDFNRNEINKIISSLKNDTYLKTMLVVKETPENHKGTGENRTEKIFYIELSSVLVNNISLIKSYSIDEIIHPNRYKINEGDKLTLNKLYIDVKKVLITFGGIPQIIANNKDLYRGIIFVIKHLSVKDFFTKNYYKFLPSYDFMNIQKSNKTKLFVDSIMKEFDKFASIIEDISCVTDIDSIPSEYINYLAQLVGYQKDIDDSLFNYITFREFIKNIIEVYKIKGTSYSIELFFGFIGFVVDIKELWFDKRFYFLNENIETGFKDNRNFNYYLTKIDPKTRTLGGRKVVDEDMIDTKNLYNFNKLLEGGAPVEPLLGIGSSHKTEKYTYFKTNLITIDVTPYSSSVEINPERQNLIQNYIKFLIPIFIQNLSTNYKILEPVESGIKANTLYLYDLDKIDYDNWEEGYNYSVGDVVQINLEVYKSLNDHISSDSNAPNIGNSIWEFIGRTHDFTSDATSDYMLHTYSGYQPKRYEWDGGIENYGNFKEGKGGIYPSGFYNGVSKKLNDWDFNKSDSDNLLGLLPMDVDVIKPLREEFGGKESKYHYYFSGSEAPILMNKNFSYVKGSALRNSTAFSENLSNTIIKSIVVSTGKIKVLKHSPYTVSDFSVGSQIEVHSKSLSNRGVYTIKGVTTYLENIYIEVEEELFENQSTEGGFILPYREEWLYENFMHSFMSTDNIENEKQEYSWNPPSEW